jgi:hypothetical protein
VLDIEVSAQVDLTRRRGSSLVQSNLRKRIEDDVVIRLDQRAHRAKAGRPPRLKNRDSRHPQQRAQLRDEHGGGVTKPFEGRPGGGMHTKLRNRRLHGLPYIRMLGQSEKIRDAEIHACRGSSRCAGA